jgi:hypothetical protein
VIHLRLAKGGEADVTAVDGERITLSSTASAPPGASLDTTLGDGTPMRIKVRGCKKVEERFHIEGRIIDLSRALRERLGS